MGTKGFAYALVHRKNDQRMIGQWHTVADIGPGCFARRFKQLVRDMNPGIQIPDLKWGFAAGPGADSYVFRLFGAPRGAPKEWRRRRCVTRILDGGTDPVTLEDSNKFYADLAFGLLIPGAAWDLVPGSNGWPTNQPKLQAADVAWTLQTHIVLKY